MSRRYGGIHFEDGDLDSRRLGRLVAGAVWDRAQAYIHGTVPASQPVALGALHGSERSGRSGMITRLTATAGSGVRVSFALAAPALVHARVLDLQGRTVARLADAEFGAGTHELAWRGAGPSGVYFVRVEAPGGAAVQRVAIVR